VSSAKAAEPIEKPCVIWTRVGPRKHALDGIQIRAHDGQFWGRKGAGMSDRRHTPSNSAAGAAPVRCGCRFGMF